ncbi:hypothetical protein ABE41_003380 [Fictibacillus arsenicus]|uniref:Uncharacterized protein n=1 Tax=Fictibacillus arsenicus TaxID=255247 RepID=A0A1B1Z0V7_9BACL|nr:hypothetical protein [Fictibacillus arsenicus]ANX11035.1 hypothetical protein ABE41_003380 [Fictibacillus arsenicus]
MTEKIIILFIIAFLFFDFRAIKQDEKLKRIYIVLSVPAIYLVYSFVFGKNFPNLDEFFYFIFGPLAETVISWLKVK